MKSDLKTMNPGEHVVTTYPIKKETGGTGDKTITNLDSILDFIYNHIIDGGMVPPISKQWNSTNASAEEMMPWARANLIQPMQRIISEVVEEQLYKPYLMLRGFSSIVCPRLKWESPDAHKDEEAEYWSMQVQSGIVPAEYAAEAQGFDMDKINKMREVEEQKQQNLMQQQAELGQQNQNNPQQDKEEKPKLDKETVQILTKTLRESTSKPQWMGRCVRICSELVDDPAEFCGAFWNDEEQLYHGPVKTAFKN